MSCGEAGGRAPSLEGFPASEPASPSWENPFGARSAWSSLRAQLRQGRPPDHIPSLSLPPVYFICSCNMCNDLFCPLEGDRSRPGVCR